MRLLALDSTLTPIGPEWGLGYSLFDVQLVTTPAGVVLVGHVGSDGISVLLEGEPPTVSRPLSNGFPVRFQTLLWDGARIVGGQRGAVVELDERGRRVSTTLWDEGWVSAAVGTEEGLLVLQTDASGEHQPLVLERGTGRVLRRLGEGWPAPDRPSVSLATAPGEVFVTWASSDPRPELLGLRVTCTE